MRLREVTAEDAERLHRWRMEPGARAAFRDGREIPWADHLAFLERYLEPQCDDRWFVIEAEGKPIGAVALYDISSDGREAEWGRFVLAAEWRGRGLGRRALSLLIAHARELGIRHLRCEVAEGNRRAEALYRSMGFAPEGREEIGGPGFVRLSMTLEPPVER